MMEQPPSIVQKFTGKTEGQITQKQEKMFEMFKIPKILQDLKSLSLFSKLFALRERHGYRKKTSETIIADEKPRNLWGGSFLILHTRSSLF